MKALKLVTLILFGAALVIPASLRFSVESHPFSKIPAGAKQQNRKDRFRHNGVIEDEDQIGINNRRGVTEAPTGFDNLTNGFNEQGPPYDTLNEDNVVALRSFNDNRFIFEEVETVEDGLGPTFNAQSCRERHQNVVTGGASQVAKHRTGRLDNDVFFESLGGSLIQSRATHPDIVERVNLHDIGTSDGIPFLPTPEFAFTANLIRMAPLWALRTRNRLMHDGLSFTKQEAIQRHAGQATGVTNRYNALSATQKNQILVFLDSL